MWKCLEYSSWQTGICRRMLGYFKAFFLISLQIWKSRCPSVLSLTRTFTCLCFPAPCSQLSLWFEEPQKAQHHAIVMLRHLHGTEQCFHAHLCILTTARWCIWTGVVPFQSRGHQRASNQLSIRKETRAQILRFLTTNCGSILQAESSLYISTSPQNRIRELKVTMSPVTPFICHKSVLNKAILQGIKH